MNIQKKWSMEEIDYLKQNYNKYTSKEIAEKLNRTVNSVQVKINKLGLKREDKYFYNINFFEQIDSEEKAYWLGFIYADGYVQKNKEKRNAELGIELQVGDIEHLRKFNKSICGNIEIKIKERFDSRYNHSNTHAIIRIYKSKIIEDLIKHGVTPNKSHNITFPQLNKDLLIPFIRGFFDGDGCIQLNKQRNCHRFDFACASISFIESLRKILYEDYHINSYIVKETNKEVYRLNIRGLTNAYLFGSLLYDNANIYLDRKYKKFYSINKEYNIINRLKIK